MLTDQQINNILDIVEKEECLDTLLYKAISKDNRIVRKAIGWLIYDKNCELEKQKEKISHLAYGMSTTLLYLTEKKKLSIGRQLFNGLKELINFFEAAPIEKEYHELLAKISKIETDLV